MTQAVLMITSNIIPCRTCAPLSISEIHSELEKNKRNKFDTKILRICSDSMMVTDDKPLPTNLDILNLVEDEHNLIH